MADPYGIEARARFVAEPPKRAGRSPFERDRARIVHSSALRRLSAKTQVMTAGTHDFVRNRRELFLNRSSFRCPNCQPRPRNPGW